ncbi:MAG: hypothetical protein HZC23_03535 [Rhodocyclales bacterium]|nr:hypothetical protein [Rhodocyclales bacterium]
MGRRRVAGWLATTMLLVARAALAVPSAMQMEPVMQLAWQLSAPAASEDERDLLRREYRLIQGAGEFWVGFDNLNARIHGTADMVSSLRVLIEGAPAPRPQRLLAGLDKTPAEPAPIAMALPGASVPLAGPVREKGGMVWPLAGAVLGGLTLFLFRMRRAQGQPRPAVVARSPAAPDVPPEPEAPPQADEAADGLKRHTVPAPEAAPSLPVDPVREEMDHALGLAEVMLSYGRTTGAMQALKDYLHDHPATSLRPWLKLLDLHRQTGMREDFERAAATVHGHFNVRVPGWDEGVAGEPLRSFFDDEEHTEILCLEQIPHILAKVQATWPDAACLEYLRHLLVDNRGGERMGFPVSVVTEILLLEDILNDRLSGPA